ncbi:hypothetical protein C8F04DRAFT_1068359 [Mycena alexandri]|uniref:F-box domain-containing protein n=1 Tax=Mycena alexandri TaxID=1745969 RepID=A0AAD6TEW7_9AGAR|nr:hypothetical protein C8F04DRAFT_1068359 [Mycena alexandri]
MPASNPNDALRARASSLSSDIEKLQLRTQSDTLSTNQALNDLLTARAAVQAKLDAITYEIWTLPAEIVAQVFCWTLVPSRSQPKSTPRKEPWRLGQICRVWREIALSTPELWNTIEISTGPHISDHYGERIRTILSRAASLPLAISFTLDDQCNFITDYTSTISHFLTTIVPHSHTWEDIDLSSITPASLDALQLVHHQLPLLKFLVLALRTRPHDGKLSAVFNDAPLLRKVHLSNFGSQPFALPWAQLTSLDVSNCYGTEVAEILGWTPALVNLNIGVIWSPIPPLPPLPHLRSLVFGNGSLLSLQSDLLSRLDVPLRRLKIAVAPFWLAHPASLEELSVAIELQLKRWTGPLLLEGLTSTSALRTLKITVHNYEPTPTTFSLDPLIHRLTHDPGFLSGLESLTIIILEQPSSEHPPFNSIILSCMLGARCHSRGGALRYFELRSRRDLPVLDLQVVELVGSGTEIVLVTDPDLAFDLWSTEF